MQHLTLHLTLLHHITFSVHPTITTISFTASYPVSSSLRTSSLCKNHIPFCELTYPQSLDGFRKSFNPRIPISCSCILLPLHYYYYTSPAQLLTYSTAIAPDADLSRLRLLSTSSTLRRKRCDVHLVRVDQEISHTVRRQTVISSLSPSGTRLIFQNSPSLIRPFHYRFQLVRTSPYELLSSLIDWLFVHYYRHQPHTRPTTKVLDSGLDILSLNFWYPARQSHSFTTVIRPYSDGRTEILETDTSQFSYACFSCIQTFISSISCSEWTCPLCSLNTGSTRCEASSDTTSFQPLG